MRLGSLDGGFKQLLFKVPSKDRAVFAEAFLSLGQNDALLDIRGERTYFYFRI